MAQQQQDGLDMAQLKNKISPQTNTSTDTRGFSSRQMSPDIVQFNAIIPQRKYQHYGPRKRTPSPTDPSQRSPSGTPPLSPGIYNAANNYAVTDFRTDLPTPPISPEGQRITSPISAHVSKPQYYPKGLNSSQDSNQVSSKLSSSGGIATYRGPEMTRTGEQTMLQIPSQQILSNPLSQFSRPRQSTLTSSPDKQRAESGSIHAQVLGIQDVPLEFPRPQSMPAQNSVPAIRDTPAQPPLGAQSLRSARTHPVEEVRSKRQEKTFDNGRRSASEAPSDRRKSLWRRSFNPQEHSERSSSAKPKKDKRRSFSFMRSNSELSVVSYADAKAGLPPAMKKSLKGELPSNRTSVYQERAKAEDFEGSFSQHPAVRPHSMTDMPGHQAISGSQHHSDKIIHHQHDHKSQPDIKGKGKEEDSPYPTYERCSCCGKLRKPKGSETALSPVLENEHLRTNFSFELGRTSNGDRRRSFTSIGPSGRPKHIPIIPMEVGNQMRQATIQSHEMPVGARQSNPSRVSNLQGSRPHSIATVGLSRTGDRIAQSSQPLATMPNAESADQQMGRFSSLHTKRIIPQRSTAMNNETIPPVPDIPRRFGSLYTSKRMSAPVSNEPELINGTTPVPLVESSQLEEAMEVQPLSAEQSVPDRLSLITDPDLMTEQKRQSVVDRGENSSEEIIQGMDLSSIDGSFFGNTVSPIIASELRELNSTSTPKLTADEVLPPTTIEQVAGLPGSISSQIIQSDVDTHASQQAVNFERTENIGGESSNETVAVPPTSPSAKTTSYMTSPIARKPVPLSTEASNESPQTAHSPQQKHDSRPSPHTTIVRIIKTPEIPERSTARPTSFIDNTGRPVMIGDWILPRPRNVEEASPHRVSSPIQTSALPSPLQIGRTSMEEQGYNSYPLPHRNSAYSNTGLSVHGASADKGHNSTSSMNSSYTELTSAHLEEATSGRIVNGRSNGMYNANVVMVDGKTNHSGSETRQMGFGGSMGSEIARRMREAEIEAEAQAMNLQPGTDKSLSDDYFPTTTNTTTTISSDGIVSVQR